ncbi:MAG: hypothetical protein ABUT20_28425 [Bacteroidota bacterium]
MTLSEQELKVSLTKVIEKWSENECSGKNWPDAYWYETQAEDMAEAAFIVFMASVKGQDFAKKA